MTNLNVLCFVSLGFSFWMTSIYLFWLLDFELHVGIIESGKIHSQWWLPSAVIFWTVLSYYSAKK